MPVQKSKTSGSPVNEALAMDLQVAIAQEATTNKGNTKKRKRNDEIFQYLKKVKLDETVTQSQWPSPLNEPLRSVPDLINEKGLLSKQALASIQALRIKKYPTRTILLHLMPTLDSSNYAGARRMLIFNFFKKVTDLLGEKALVRQLDSAMSNRLKLENSVLDLKQWFEINPGQVFSLPLSWAKNNKSGHAIILNIKPDQQNQTYTLEIFNVGQGSGRIRLNKNNHETLVASVIRIKNIEPSKIGSPAFVKALYTLNSTVMSKADSYVYDFLARYLGGDTVTEKEAITFALGQIIGNCSWESLWLWALDFLKENNRDQEYIDRFHLNVRTFALLLHYATVIPVPTVSGPNSTGIQGYDSDSDFETPDRAWVNDKEKDKTQGSEYERDLYILLNSVRELATFASRCGVYEQALTATLIKNIEGVVENYLSDHAPTITDIQPKKKKPKATKLAYTKPPEIIPSDDSYRLVNEFGRYPILNGPQVIQGNFGYQEPLDVLSSAEGFGNQLIKLMNANTKTSMTEELAHQALWLYAAMMLKLSGLERSLRHSQYDVFSELADLIQIKSQPIFQQLGTGNIIHDLPVRKTIAQSENYNYPLIPAGMHSNYNKKSGKLIRWAYRHFDAVSTGSSKTFAEMLTGIHSRSNNSDALTKAMYSSLRNLTVLMINPDISVEHPPLSMQSFFRIRELGNDQYSVSWGDIKRKSWNIEKQLDRFQKACYFFGNQINQHGILPSSIKQYQDHLSTTLALLRCKHPVISAFEKTSLNRLLAPIEAIAMMKSHPGILSTNTEIVDYLQAVILEDTLLENLPNTTLKTLNHTLFELQTKLLSEGAFKAAGICAYLTLFLGQLSEFGQSSFETQSLKNAFKAAKGDSSSTELLWYCATLTNPMRWSNEVLKGILTSAAQRTRKNTDTVPDLKSLAAEKRWKENINTINDRIARSPDVLSQLPWNNQDFVDIDWGFFDDMIETAQWRLSNYTWSKDNLRFDTFNCLMEEGDGVHSAIPGKIKRNLPHDLRFLDALALKSNNGKLYSFSDQFDRHTIVNESEGVWRSLVQNDNVYFEKIKNPKQCIDIPDDVLIHHDLYGYMTTQATQTEADPLIIDLDSPLFNDEQIGLPQNNVPANNSNKAANRKARHFVLLNKKTGKICFVQFSLCQLRRLDQPIEQLPALSQKIFDKTHPFRIRIQEQLLDKKASDVIRYIGGNEYLAEGGRNKIPQIHWPSIGLTISLEKQHDGTHRKRISAPIELSGWRVLGRAEPPVAEGFPLGIEVTNGDRQCVLFASKLPKSEDFDGLKRQPELFLSSGPEANLSLVLCNRCPRTQELIPHRAKDAIYLALIHSAYMHYDKARRLLDHIDVYGKAFGCRSFLDHEIR